MSRVSQFENRDSRKRKSKKADDAGDDKEPAQPLPTTPKTGTSTPEPATKKDHEEAKKLLRSERLHGADQTRRYLFEERIFESEPEARPGLDKGEEQKGSEEDGKDCFLGSRVEGFFLLLVPACFGMSPRSLELLLQYWV